MDLQTTFYQIARMLKATSTTVDPVVEADILRAIAESLEYNRLRPTTFNVKNLTIQLSADQEVITDSGTTILVPKIAYTLPEDYLGLLGEVLYARSLGQGAGQVTLTNQGPDMIQEWRGTDLAMLGDFGGRWAYDTGSYAIDDAARNILIVGVNEGYVKLRYVSDLGSIKYKNDGTSWIFYQPFTETVLTKSSTYTNAWFREGNECLIHRALYYLYSREHGGTQESNEKAMIHLGHWSESINKLDAETNRKKSRKSIRPWI